MLFAAGYSMELFFFSDLTRTGSWPNKTWQSIYKYERYQTFTASLLHSFKVPSQTDTCITHKTSLSTRERERISEVQHRFTSTPVNMPGNTKLQTPAAKMRSIWSNWGKPSTSAWKPPHHLCSTTLDTSGIHSASSWNIRASGSLAGGQHEGSVAHHQKGKRRTPN